MIANGTSDDAPKPACNWCGMAHMGIKCYLVRAFEYYPDGRLSRVEFFNLTEFAAKEKPAEDFETKGRA